MKDVRLMETYWLSASGVLARLWSMFPMSPRSSTPLVDETGSPLEGGADSLLLTCW